MKRLYAIYDNVAKAIIQQIQMENHDTVAIRFYGDVANMQGSMVNKHPKDFDLICLGHIDEEGEITPYREVVITGAAWHAMQEKDTTRAERGVDVPLSLGKTTAE